MPMRGKNILVAGGSGLIGMNLVKQLKPLKANVLSTYYSRKPHSTGTNCEYFDFTRFEHCLKATRKIDYCFICAYQSAGIKALHENPSASLLPNLKIAAGLLEACSRNKVKRVVLVSSSTVYQENRSPIKETQLDLNKPPYKLYTGIGWLNRYIEQLAKLYHKKGILEIGIVRPSYVYGPYDNFDERRSHVIPALIKRALNKERPFIVWGSGSVVRDFIYAEDLADGLIEVMDKYCAGKAINISSGKGNSIRKLVDIVLDACHYRIKPRYDKTKPTSIGYRVLDNGKFTSLFGNKKCTSLKQGIENTVKWYLSKEA